jgi:cell division transport system permease protein
MLWIHLRRVLRSGFVNFWRTPVVSLASVVTLTVALFVIGAMVLFNAFLYASLDDLRARVDISVSFKPDAPETRVLELQESLEALPEVAAVTFRSRAEELTEFEERNKDNDLILRSLAEVGNPFGARLNIQAVDPGSYEAIASFLEEEAALAAGGETVIDQISFKKNVVDRLVRLISVSERVSLAVSLVLIFIAVVVTFNTISLAIYSSREEISLMKLVGAGNNYVRGPFVVEGVMAGILASIFSIIFLYPASIWLRGVTINLYGGIDLVSYFLGNFAKLFFILLAAGVLLGVSSSFLAVRKHLKI